MPTSIIPYDKDLPEIPGRLPWLEPNSHLVKDPASENKWLVQPGRRPSNLLVVNKLRAAVHAWRAAGYPGASSVTQRLFSYWFDEDHEVAGYDIPFHFYFGQREAIETLAYLVEIAQLTDVEKLIRDFASIKKISLIDYNLEFTTTMDGRRRLRRYFPELNITGTQDLPPPNLPRFAFKMATGSGKTWVMALAIVWSHFHKRLVPNSPLSTNFLIVAPNVIVYERLERDFASNKIFYDLPLIPPEWRGTWRQKVILRGESTEPDPSGNLFLTNIHQIYESRDAEWTPANAVDAMLGRTPNKDLASYQRSMLQRIKSLKDLLVINDEAHHVHDPDLAWSESLDSINTALPKGFSLWLDFSATPKFSKGEAAGTYYPWSVVDYPLAQAVEDRIVKAPIIVTREDDKDHPAKDPDNVTATNVIDKYGFWIRAAVARWKQHNTFYKQLNLKPVLFIMAEQNKQADAIHNYLVGPEFGFKSNQVQVLHTDAEGEILQKDLSEARAAVNAIDDPASTIQVIVSVMMLREGWDVKNVTIVLGKRPFRAKAEILPEQVVGRGLRLIPAISPDKTQTLEVFGTKNLLGLVRERLEVEGVSVVTTKSTAQPGVIIEAVLERAKYDIAIPITKPVLTHNIKKLSTINILTLDALYNSTDLDLDLRSRLKYEFATVNTEVSRETFQDADIPMSQSLLSAITTKVMTNAGLPNVFAELYPMVRTYVGERCFGDPVDLDKETVRRLLREPHIQDAIAKFLAQRISALTAEKRALVFQNKDNKLSKTAPFTWRRNLPPLVCDKTIFNYVATYNPFEREFAEFLDAAKDVARFAALGTTEQGDSGTQFRVDYLKPSGAIGFYYPDWVAVQKTGTTETNWILETKGRVWEGTAEKDAAIQEWCARITTQTNKLWQFHRVNQPDFVRLKPKTLTDITATQTLLVPEL